MQTDAPARLDPKTTAVVVVDMINHQVTRGRCFLGDLERDGVDVDYMVERLQSLVIPNLQRLLSACRQRSVTVAYLRVGAYRSDYSDLVPAFQDAFRSWEAREGTWACEVIEPLRPAAGDIDLIKTGSGGFNTSGLDSHLRNIGIRNILYTGVITNGCVLLTAASGFDLGYNGYLVTDTTATLSQELQQATEETMALYVAKPVSTGQVLNMLDHGC